VPKESPIRGDIFLITSSDPWYGDILIYIQTLKWPTTASHDEHRCICHQAKNYLILNDTLYQRGVDCILHQCLTHEEAVIVINDCILELVAVICLGWKQPKRFYEQVTSGRHLSKIISNQSRSAIYAKSSLGR
jgi:hypothetical protein